MTAFDRHRSNQGEEGRYEPVCVDDLSEKGLVLRDGTEHSFWGFPPSDTRWWEDAAEGDPDPLRSDEAALTGAEDRVQGVAGVTTG